MKSKVENIFAMSEMSAYFLAGERNLSLNFSCCKSSLVANRAAEMNAIRLCIYSCQCEFLRSIEMRKNQTDATSKHIQLQDERVESFTFVWNRVSSIKLSADSAIYFRVEPEPFLFS